MTRETIAFIGGGHMASSLIAGLVSDGYDPANLIVSEPDADKREQLARHYGVRVTQDNATAQGAADVVLLCVKPQMAHAVCSAWAWPSPPRSPSISR
jgi:pyrroline-5-carboxylate reductase